MRYANGRTNLPPASTNISKTGLWQTTKWNQSGDDGVFIEQGGWPMRRMLIAAIFLLFVGFIGLIAVNQYLFMPTDRRPLTPDRPSVPGRPFMRPAPRIDTRSFSSNGERIFLTGNSARGRIRSTGGPAWFQRRGGGCAQCHGIDGRGGEVTIMMQRFSAPDITFAALTSGEEIIQEETSTSSDEEQPHTPYTEESIKRAITQGIDSSGNELNRFMPRWSMSDQDLSDVIDHLKALSQ